MSPDVPSPLVMIGIVALSLAGYGALAVRYGNTAEHSRQCVERFETSHAQKVTAQSEGPNTLFYATAVYDVRAVNPEKIAAKWIPSDRFAQMQVTLANATTEGRDTLYTQWVGKDKGLIGAYVKDGHVQYARVRIEPSPAPQVFRRACALSSRDAWLATLELSAEGYFDETPDVAPSGLLTGGAVQ